MHAGGYAELFHENVVMTMESLKMATGRPRESILRDLKGIGYFSSYNARGKFYALGGTPEFDDLGLWRHRDAYFSIRHTLLDTAEYLVSGSNAGFTHDELRRILGIEIQNSLHQLTTAGRIARQQVGRQYVYFGKESIAMQFEERRAIPIEPIARNAAGRAGARPRPDVDPVLVIEILVAALRGHETDSAAHGYLRQTGSKATGQQVAAVFRYYDIGKKNSAARK
jgi:hypothetical protein